jgi:para-nitrobenzyl esterase
LSITKSLGKRAFSDSLLGGTLGAPHGVDLPFVFGLTETSGAVVTGGGPEEEALSTLTMDAWLAFARNGNPKCRSS